MTTAIPAGPLQTLTITGININPIERLKYPLRVELSIDGAKPQSIAFEQNQKPVGDRSFESSLILKDGSRLSVNVLKINKLNRNEPLVRLNLTLKSIWPLLESSAPDSPKKKYVLDLPDPPQQLWLNITVPPSLPQITSNDSSPSSQAGGGGRDNPGAAKALADATERLQEFKSALSYLGFFKDPLKKAFEIAETFGELHPVGSAVVKVVGIVYDNFEAEDKHREEMLNLASSMTRTLGSLPTVDKIAEFPELKDTIDMFPSLLNEFVEFMEKWLVSGISKFLNVSKNQQKIDDLKARFDIFEKEFDRGVVIDGVVKIDYVAKSQKLDDLEKRLGGVVKVERLRATECLQGTRTNIISEIEVKIDTCEVEADAGNIIWIRGAPGSGKSAVSLTLKSRLHRSGRLVTYFGFDRTDTTVMTPQALWCRVAYDLADRYPSVLKHNLSLLQENKVNLTSTKDIFTFLVEEPLLNLIEPPPAQPIVIVIDALDESGGTIGRSSPDREALLDTLKCWPQLPPRFKLLITSRGERDIIRILSSISSPIDIPSGRFLTDNPDAKASILASKDIQSFLEMRFGKIRESVPLLPQGWPGNTAVAKMVGSAAGNFMWATAASRFIESGLDPQKHLERILDGTLGSTDMKPLHSLYLTILEISFADLPDNSSDAEALRAILGTVVFAQEPFWDIEFTSLPTTEPITGNLVASIRDRLHSVVDQGSTVLRFVHKSFDDFLLSGDCPPKYAISMKGSHHLLTQLCLNTMIAELRFNICGLQTSCLGNKDVPDIDAKVRDCISEILRYSCYYWADHLIHTPVNALMSDVKKMILDKLLYWFEVMSLLDKISRITHSMRLVLDWLMSTSYTELRDLIHDANRFIGAFSVPIERSAPHIYISALPFAPEGSLIAEHFFPRFPRILALSEGKPTTWSPCISTLQLRANRPQALFFSPSGKHLVIGYSDGTTLIVDPETWNLVASPFRCSPGFQYTYFDIERHIWACDWKGQVVVWDLETGSSNPASQAGAPWMSQCVLWCCRFNGGGRNIVTLSHGGEFILWNADTGVQLRVMTQMDGDKRWAFPGDGCYMALAGGGDTMIRFWGLVDGHEIRSPSHSEPQFTHPQPIRALCSANDAPFAVSASEDGTIIIWDAKTGETFGRPLANGWVDEPELAYSHKHELLIVISGLSGAVIVWNTSTHEAVLGPLEGHTAPVCAITLSPNGQRAFSADVGGTIKVWDLENKGPKVLENYATQGHVGRVDDIVFSPFGDRLASIGCDKTLRVWDTSTGNPLRSISTGALFRKLLFSPSGSQIIAFDSTDAPFRVWNADTGELIFSPDSCESYVGHAAFRLTDNQLVTCSSNGVVRIWTLEENVMTENHSAPSPQLVDANKRVKVLAISADGLGVIVHGHAENPEYYEYNTTRLPLPSPVYYFWSDDDVAPIPSGSDLEIQVDSGNSRRSLVAWRIESGELAEPPMPNDHSTRITTWALSPNKHYLAVTLSRDKMGIWIMDARTRAIVSGPWKRHVNVLTALAFSPDGGKLVSASVDGQIRFWDTASLLGSKKSTGFLRAGTQISNGWVMDEDGHLLFWLPNDHRSRLVWPDDVLTIGGSGIQTELDLTRFRYGEHWTECFRGGE